LGDPTRMEAISARHNLLIELFGHLRERRSMGPQERLARLKELVDERVQLGGVLRIEVGAESDLRTYELHITSKQDQQNVQK
jgi:hypothetical protein